MPNNIVPICRNGRQVGRTVYDGRKVSVEQFVLIGFYEGAQSSTWPRKISEINDVFESWTQVRAEDASRVKVAWRKKKDVSNFNPLPGEDKTGCSVVLLGSIEIAQIYNSRPPGHARWVWGATTVADSPRRG